MYPETLSKETSDVLDLLKDIAAEFYYDKRGAKWVTLLSISSERRRNKDSFLLRQARMRNG